ncbi:hypothetical protein OV203_38605 [Nannocystis sp. ILAH1]|uniref:hypothetical protein n=1 Tax=Nannocystis sp. ILAH1 TaxID=2996789 RepID=UPI0022719576|nr:hypothetical protein [Nannocystis sp. ILAH1]MCY0993116.1 hypothetical protein [Nannocystis sp. ILAH1]
MPLNLLDFVSAPTLITTVLAGEAICPLMRQAVVIPILVAFLALFLSAVVRPQWIDKSAGVTLLLLAVLTKPDRAQHLTALREAGSLNDPAHIHGDYLFVSATTGDATLAIGVFGRVFVFQRERSPPQ